MFELTNFKYSETMLLNITNGVLGLATVGLIVWICGSAIHEFILQHRSPHNHHHH